MSLPQIEIPTGSHPRACVRARVGISRHSEGTARLSLSADVAQRLQLAEGSRARVHLSPWGKTLIVTHARYWAPMDSGHLCYARGKQICININTSHFPVQIPSKVTRLKFKIDSYGLHVTLTTLPRKES